MAGVFKIHPTGGSTITLDTLDSDLTLLYLLVSQDLKESEREKIIYSEGKFDGSVIDSSASIVTVEFELLINGDTLEEIAANIGTIKAAFFNLDGGYIEYRPVGYSASVLSTFYKYLRSAPPERINDDVVINPSSEDFALAQMFRFQIKIFSLATSDPDSLQSIASGTIYNFLQNGDNANKSTGYLLIPEAGIKGDGFIANIALSPMAASSSVITDVLAHIYKCAPAEAGKEFYNEATGGFSSYTDDTRHVISSASSATLTFAVEADAQDSYGRVTPVFSYENISGDWEYKIEYNNIVGNTIILVDWTALNPILPSYNFNLEIGESFNFPYYQRPPGGTLLTSALIEVSLRTIDSSSQSISFYGLLLLRADGNSWAAPFSFSGGMADVNIPLVLDGYNGISYNYYQPTELTVAPWEKQGNSLKDLIFPKGDYQLRVLHHGTVSAPDAWHHNGPSRLGAAVEGIFYTIYPFAET